VSKTVVKPYVKPQDADLYGVGGWLALYCIMIAIFRPAVEIVGFAAKPTAYGIIDLAYAGFSMLTGFALWKRWPRALTLTQVTLITQFLLGVLASAMEVERLAAEVGTGASSKPDSTGLQMVAASIIWLAYFHKSKRVRATYGHNLWEGRKTAALESSHNPLPSTKVIVSAAVRELDAPVPLPVTAPSKVDTAAQTPSPAPPGGIGETPTAQPQANKPITAASRPPKGVNPQQLRTISEPDGKMKFVAIAGVALVLIVAGVWYFSHHRLKVETRVNPKDGLKYVWIPPGTFMMGCSPGDNECSDIEKPPHQVTITKGFWIGQTPVTVGAYKRFAAATGRQMPGAPTFNSSWANGSMPIVQVTWDDAHDYCTWAGGRLPSEAEWEYAARAGSRGARYGPLDEIAWYAGNSRDKTHPVGEKQPNGFGLYDMLGNVAEWANDWFLGDYYDDSDSEDPPGPEWGIGRVLCGGGWYDDASTVRVSHRGSNTRGTSFGFRCGGEVFAPSANVTSPVPAKLSETLQWLKGASEEESSDGNTHIAFKSNGRDSCTVTITETRAKASPGFWIRASFSLADIDPEDIQVEDLGTGDFKKIFAGQYAVRFHTANYAKKIIFISWDHNEPIHDSHYTVFTNESFGPKFARAFKQAVELCGGKQSSF
jgi:formylglycine-generating enzyme required for sulfatase activity